MILHLSQFDDFPAHVSLELNSAEYSGLRDDVRELMGGTLDMDIQQSGREFFCQARINAEVVLDCARCLSPYTAKVGNRTDFIIRLDPVTSGEEAQVDDDEDYVFVQDNDLRADFTDQVRQMLILALPMKPLCTEACQGLCPVCGTNRNTGRCNCVVDRIDPRWEGLRGLNRGQ